MILKQPKGNQQLGQNTETNTTTKEQQKIHQCITCEKSSMKTKTWLHTHSKQTNMKTNMGNRI